jgi:hypothetical protein
MCDRTTSEMQGPSSRIQIGWFSMNQECIKHTYKAYKIRISLKIKLLHVSLKITRMRSRRCFQKIEHVCGSISLNDQGIHLALEVKTSFGSSTPTTGSSMESNSQKPRVPTDSRHQHRQNRWKKKPTHKERQSKAWATTLSMTDPSWRSGHI